MPDQERPISEGRVLTSKGPIAKEVRFLVYATVALYVVLVAVIAVGAVYFVRNQNTNRRLGMAGQQAHQAICTLRAGLVHRVADSREFLRTHPKGIAGIPAATIATSINNQQQTIDALRVIRCEP